MNYHPWSDLPEYVCASCHCAVIKRSYSPSRSEWVHEGAYLNFKQEPHEIQDVIEL